MKYLCIRTVNYTPQRERYVPTECFFLSLSPSYFNKRARNEARQVNITRLPSSSFHAYGNYSLIEGDVTNSLRCLTNDDEIRVFVAGIFANNKIRRISIWYLVNWLVIISSIRGKIFFMTTTARKHNLHQI